MTNLSQVTEMEMKKLIQLMEKTINSHPGKRVTVDRSARYITTSAISTLKTHSVHDDDFLTLIVNDV